MSTTVFCRTHCVGCIVETGICEPFKVGCFVESRSRRPVDGVIVEGVGHVYNRSRGKGSVWGLLATRNKKTSGESGKCSGTHGRGNDELSNQSIDALHKKY